MATLNPYLNFNGNTEEAFNFYRSIFGGDFYNVTRFKDTTMADQIPGDAQDKIMHISLPIGNGNLLMATDAIESMGQKLTNGNNYSLSLTTESEAETERLFHALSEGGKIDMPLEKAFWGAYFGMFHDKFGIQWMVNYPYDQNK